VQNYQCDVLVIGAGSAGLRAAIEAHDAGANVLILSKNRKGDPHTVLARGGINAALGTMDPQDNWLVHAVDTLREGGFIADYEKVQVLCKNAPAAIRELVDWGARFHKEPDGRLTQRFFGAHTYRRTCFYGDWTGKEIIRVLMKKVRQRKIRIIDSIYISKLLTSDELGPKEIGKEKEEQEDDGRFMGAIGIDTKHRNIVLFQSKSLILAAGGYSRVYTPSSSRIFENYGEGAALAYEVGAELADMEMVQFHPTGMVWPKKALGTLATEAIRGEGGILLNSKGERFMKNYYPQRMELGPRDIVARSNYKEIISGRGTKHGGVWLDISHVPKKTILERLPSMYRQFKEIAKIDISKEKMEVAPTAHYSMGGVIVDDKCRTRVRGLFAVGEVSGQVHGANRLGGNSLLGTVVFGKIAGREAALQAIAIKKKGGKRRGILPLMSSPQHNKQIIKLVDSNSKILAVKAIKFRSEIQEIMRDNVGIIREDKKLRKGLKEILALKKKFYSKYNNAKNLKINENSVSALEVKFALVVCEAIVRSALMRKESRGAHYRSDFPKTNDRNWKVNIIITSRAKNKRGDKIDLYTKKVKRVKGPLSRLVNRSQTTTAVAHHLLE
jgi:succinate dehydrogenase/fumarate reductase flavoprotein subunit